MYKIYIIYLLNATRAMETAKRPQQRNGVKSGTIPHTLKTTEKIAIIKLENIILSFGLLLKSRNDLNGMKNIAINIRFPSV